MIVLRCVDGVVWRTKKPCTYEVTYKDDAAILNQAKSNGLNGFHCPACSKYPLRVLRTKPYNKQQQKAEECSP